MIWLIGWLLEKEAQLPAAGEIWILIRLKNSGR